MSDDSEIPPEEDVKSSALRRAGLRIGDPRAQENRIERVPEGVVPDGIVNQYEFREEKVRCAVCKERQYHNIGITLSLPGGTKALCGSKCAENLYGREIWHRLDLDFKAREREIILKTVVEPMPEIIRRSRDLANPWFGPAKAIRDFLKDLYDTAPEFLESLRQAVRRDDSRLEAKNADFVWTIRGGVCLLNDAIAVLNSVGDRIREAEALLAWATEKVENLERLSRLIGELRRGLNEAANLLVAGRQFIDPANLRAIAKWANLWARSGHRHKVFNTPEGLIYEIETGKDCFGDMNVWEIIVPRWPDDFPIADSERISWIFA